MLPAGGEEWLALVDRLPAAGAALQLARQCVWLGRDQRRLLLGLAPTHKVLLSAQDRLLELLGALLGPVRIDIRLDTDAGAPPAGVSAAARDHALRTAQLSEAEQAIAADPVVQALTGIHGGVLVPGSIRPRDASIVP
jgi:DNA polymerase-3 subunit gamma/tau